MVVVGYVWCYIVLVVTRGLVSIVFRLVSVIRRVSMPWAVVGSRAGVTLQTCVVRLVVCFGLWLSVVRTRVAWVCWRVVRLVSWAVGLSIVLLRVGSSSRVLCVDSWLSVCRQLVMLLLGGETSAAA